MYNLSSRPQVQYTLDALADALYRLMARTPFASISVTALCNEAGVGRRSYYRNCESMEDLIVYQIRRLVQQNLDQVNFQSEDAVRLYRFFFAYWFLKRDFLRTTFEQGFSQLFFQEFTEYCNRIMDYRFLSEVLSGKARRDTFRLYHHAFLLGGLCNVLAFWAREDFSTPVELLVDVLMPQVPAVIWRDENSESQPDERSCTSDR